MTGLLVPITGCNVAGSCRPVGSRERQVLAGRRPSQNDPLLPLELSLAIPAVAAFAASRRLCTNRHGAACIACKMLLPSNSRPGLGIHFNVEYFRAATESCQR